MALKTFNLNEQTYKQFSKHCKSQGISMSKKIENFIKQELEQINSLLQKQGKTNTSLINTKKLNNIKENPPHFSKYC